MYEHSLGKPHQTSFLPQPSGVYSRPAVPTNQIPVLLRQGGGRDGVGQAMVVGFVAQ